MRGIGIGVVVGVLVSAGWVWQAEGGEPLSGTNALAKVRIDYFFEAGCPECETIDKVILPELAKTHGGTYLLYRWDVGIKSNYLHLVHYQEKLQKESNEPVSMVINERRMLDGLQAIRDGLIPKMPEYLDEVRETKAQPIPSPVSAPALASVGALKSRVGRFTMPAVILAGLGDGINPCAISTLVFFMSLLGVSNVKGRGLLLMGLAFCLASFLTYTTIGFGLLRVLHVFTGFPVIRFAIEMAMIAVLGLFAYLSFRDAYRYSKTRDAQDVSLQLPHRIKLAIHKVMRSGLGMGSLLLGGLLVGSAVTALESVCTGQVYVPTLVLVIKDGQANARTWTYLLLYNVMFILPLVAVFFLAYSGLRTQALIDWSKRNLIRSKVLLGSIFLLLAMLLLLLR